VVCFNGIDISSHSTHNSFKKEENSNLTLTTLNENNKNKNFEPISSVNEIKIDKDHFKNLPFVNLKIINEDYSINCAFLVDTGAAISLIKRNVFKTFNSDINLVLRKNKVQIKGIEKSESISETDGTLYLNFKIENIKFNHMFHVSNSMEY
jgi:hypothetical protein